MDSAPLLPLGAGITELDCRTFSVSYRLRCPLSLRQLPRQGSQDAGDGSAGVVFHVKHVSCGSIVSSFRPVVFVLDDVGDMKWDV